MSTRWHSFKLHTPGTITASYITQRALKNHCLAPRPGAQSLTYAVVAESKVIIERSRNVCLKGLLLLDLSFIILSTQAEACINKTNFPLP